MQLFVDDAQRTPIGLSCDLEPALSLASTMGAPRQSQRLQNLTRVYVSEFHSALRMRRYHHMDQRGPQIAFEHQVACLAVMFKIDLLLGLIQTASFSRSPKVHHRPRRSVL